MMGLLDVILPLIYGEDEKAFLRLQSEFVKNSSDESIFAWTDPEMHWSGIFARSPSSFARSGDIIESSFEHVERMPYSMTNRGLAMATSLGGHDPVYFSKSQRCRQILELQCARNGEARKSFQVKLIRRSKNQWARTGELIDAIRSNQSKPHPHGLKLIYTHPIFVPSLHSSPGFAVKDLRQKVAINISRDYVSGLGRKGGAFQLLDHDVRKCKIIVHAQEICIFGDEPEHWFSFFLFFTMAYWKGS